MAYHHLKKSLLRVLQPLQGKGYLLSGLYYGSNQTLLYGCADPHGVSIPLERVSAVNFTNSDPSGAVGNLKCCDASSMIDLPSGVSSANDDNTQAVIKSSVDTPLAGQKWVALRLPMVMVPVLSNSNTSMSPAVSTALPDLVITLARKALSIPAIPMADNKPPMVVGIKHTNSEIKAAMVIGVFA